MTMQVVNREGEREDVRFDAIHDKLKSLTYDLDPNWIDPGHVSSATQLEKGKGASARTCEASFAGRTCGVDGGPPRAASQPAARQKEDRGRDPPNAGRRPADV